MRRRDRERPDFIRRAKTTLGGTVDALIEQALYRLSLQGIGGARKGFLAHRRGAKGVVRSLHSAHERFVVEKSPVTQDRHEFLQLALRYHFPAREARHHHLRIEHRVRSVETPEKSDPCRRDHEHVARIAKRIA